MTGVSRDTSGDEMARAMAEWSSSPEGIASTARQHLWDRRNELRETIESLLRIAQLHCKIARLPYRERDMTRSAQQQAIVALATLSDIEKRASAPAPEVRRHSGSGG